MMRIFCSICKELFTFHAEVCVTKCGHLYHDNCLKLWQECNPSCPQCRTKIRGKPDRVYFNIEDAQVDSESDIDSLKVKIESLLERTEDLKMKNGKLEHDNAAFKRFLLQYEERAEKNKETIKILQERVNVLSREKEDLLPLRMINDSLRAELKRKTDLDALLRGTENEVHEMLSKTPVTSLAVHQLCVYVEALKHQLKKCEEKYKNETAVLMQKYETVLRQSRMAKAEKRRKINQTTNTKGNMLSDSEEEIETHKPSSGNRLHTFTSKSLPECDNSASCSSNTLQKNDCQVPQKRHTKIVKRVINNLDRNSKRDCSSDSSDIEIQIYPRPGTFRTFKSASKENISIFDKLRVNGGSQKCSKSTDPDVVYDVWGVRKKNPLATPSPIEEIKSLQMKHKKLCLKSPYRKILSHAPTQRNKS